MRFFTPMKTLYSGFSPIYIAEIRFGAKIQSAEIFSFQLMENTLLDSTGIAGPSFAFKAIPVESPHWQYQCRTRTAESASIQRAKVVV
jgi:hypothetical protein